MKRKKVKLLSASDRNILKYRSLQVMLYLFYAEDLKKFIIRSLKSTNEINGIKNQKLKFDDYLNLIVKDGVITQEEKIELVSLINFRNIIAHEIHRICSDFGDTNNSQIKNEDGSIKENYEYGSLFRIKYLTQKIHREFQKRYVIELSFDKQIFEPAEIALEHESKLLFKKMIKSEIKALYKKATS